MTKTINLTNTVYSLCSQYPEIKSVMKELGFENITDPAMLQTAGRVMTIPKGCKIKKIELQTAIESLQNHGFTILNVTEDTYNE